MISPDQEEDSDLAHGFANELAITGGGPSDATEDTEEGVEDPTLCAVCFDGEVYEGNEILFCDKCNVAVHQLCYGVKEVPEGEWFCYVCAKNLDPHSLPCELCAYKGGAYKPTDKNGKWAHPLCAVWIPELYEIAGANPPTICLTPLDTKRYRLRCQLCSKKGACVQCSYGRCTNAAHPWCVFHNSQGFTRRIIKDADGQPVWEIFCKSHASAVTDPVKPKSKRQSFPVRDEEAPEVVESVSRKPSANSLTMYTDPFDPLPSTGRAAGKGRAPGGRKPGADREPEECSSSCFPLYSLLEWPGITEGEGMDLDHYWKYVSSYFPEDHPHEWFTAMAEPFLKPPDWSVGQEPAMQPYHAPDLTREELLEQIESTLASIGSERHRAAAISISKREELLCRVTSLVSALSQSDTHISPCTSSSGDSPALALTHPYWTEDVSYFVRKNPVGRAHRHLVDKNHVPDEQTLSVLFDGAQRYRCEYAVRINPSEANDDTSVVDFSSAPSSSLVCDAKLHVMPVSEPRDPDNDVQRSSLELQRIVPVPSDLQILLPGHRHIIAKCEDTELSRLIHTDQRAYADLAVAIQARLRKLMESSSLRNSISRHRSHQQANQELHELFAKQQTWKAVCTGVISGIKDQTPDFNMVEFEKPPASWTIEVAGRNGIAKEEAQEEEEPHEDAICMVCFDGSSVDGNRIIYCDGCNITVHQVCYGIAEIPDGDFFCERCKHIQSLDDIDEIDDRNVKDLVKCALCPVYHGGLKPTLCGRWVHLACALWAPQSVIRNLAEMTDVDVYNVPVQLPRGSRGAHHNSMVLTDQANACIYCKIQGGHVVKCNYFRTAGSRSTKAAIKQEPTGEETKEGDGAVAKVKLEEGGTEAMAVDGQEEQCCETVFHPLCAWFRGAFIEATCTDETFQARDRGNLYPAGIDYSFFCMDHSIAHRCAADAQQGKALTEEQRAIRNKYCVNVSDLNQLPGKMRRKRKKYNKKKDGESMVGHHVKDLPVDKYDNHTCAYCMIPMSTDIFNSGFDVNRMVLSPAASEEGRTGDADGAPAGEPSIKAEPTSAAEQSSSFSPPNEHGSMAIKADGQQVPSNASAASPQGDQVAGTSSSQCPTGQGNGDSLVDGAAPCPSSANGNESVSAATANPSSNDNVGGANGGPAALQCTRCNIWIHGRCAQEFYNVSADALPTSGWMCPACKQGLDHSQIKCSLCPRHGGMLYNVADSPTPQYMHVFCAKLLLPSVTISATEGIEVKTVPKEYMNKNKCTICNRKNGICLPCQSLGCTHYFHPLCAKRNRVCVRYRQHRAEVYCLEHTPDFVEYLGFADSAAGYSDYVDLVEVTKFTYTLERSRLIVDQLLRREKYKKLICKAESEIFQERFHRLLDKAMHRKSSSGLDSHDLNDVLMDISDSDDDYYDSDSEDVFASGDLLAGGRADGRGGAGLGASGRGGEDGEENGLLGFVSLEDDPSHKNVTKVQVLNAEGESHEVNSTWCNHKNELRLPKRITISLAGCYVNKYTSLRYPTKTAYGKYVHGEMHHIKDSSRLNTNIFPSNKAEERFLTTLQAWLPKQIAMAEEDYQLFLQSHRLFNPNAFGKRQGADGKGTRKAKKGYVWIDEAEEQTMKEEIEEGASDEDSGYDDLESDDDDSGAEADDGHRRRSGGSAKKKLGRPRRSGSHEDLTKGSDGYASAHRSGKDGKHSSKVRHSTGSLLGSVPEAPATQQTPRRGRPPKNRNLTEAISPGSGSLSAAPAHAASAARKRSRSIESETAVEAPESGGVSQSKSKKARVSVGSVVDLLHPSHAAGSSDFDAIQQILAGSDYRQQLSRHFVRDREAGSFETTLGLLDAQLIAPAATEQHGNAFDEQVVGDQELYKLERILQDMLYQIENASVTTEPPSSTNHSAKKQSVDAAVAGGGRSVSSSQRSNTERTRSSSPTLPGRPSTRRNAPSNDPDSRLLAEALQSIPYEVIPDYNQYVRRVVSLESMRVSLQRHLYRSIEAFMHDLYTLFNNARSVTPSTSETWKDVKKLSVLCDEWKQTLVTNPCCTMPRDADRAVVATKVTSSKATGTVLACGHCEQQYRVENWPADFNPAGLLSSSTKSSDTPRRSARTTPAKSAGMSEAEKDGGSSWRWLCKSCLESLGGEGKLQGLSVQVWWHGDAVAYHGRISSFDQVSSCPCVVYEDSEWEFVNLAVEPFAFAGNVE